MNNLLSKLSLAALSLIAFSAKADTLHVVADIAPVASIISMVSGGEVDVMIAPGASPHDASLRPSQARQLQNADVVIWLGEGLSPGLLRPIAQLASQARVVSLLELDGPNYLPTRDEAIFHIVHDDHADHDDHDDHGDEAHDHGPLDPHAWLDPAVALVWVDQIAATLAQRRPEDADQFQINAKEAKERIATIQNVGALDLSGLSTIALHDGFQYLEHAMGLTITAAVTSADGTAASPARLSKLLAHAKDHQTDCVIADQSESGANSLKLANVLGLPLVILDTLGVEQALGPDLYVEMMRQIGKELVGCEKS